MLIVYDGNWYLIVSIPDLCTLIYSDVLTVDDGSWAAVLIVYDGS